MKHQYLITIAVLAALMMSGCREADTTDCIEDPVVADTNESEVVAQEDPLASLYTGNSNSRVWVIYDPGGRDAAHLIFGGAFRIEKVGDEFRMVPLQQLLNEWEKDPGFVIPLTRTEGDTPRFCGEVDLPHEGFDHEKHYLLISKAGPDKIQIEYEKYQEGVQNPCSRRQSHGGSAHAEN